MQAEIVSGRFIAARVWKAWGPALAAAGIDRATLSAVLRGYAYELWLWAAGERTWAQCLEGLAGRINRRVGARPQGRAPRRRATARGARKAPSRATKPDKAKAARATNARKATTSRKATTARKAPTSRKAPTARKATKAGRSTKARQPTKARRTTKAPSTTKARKVKG